VGELIGFVIYLIEGKVSVGFQRRQQWHLAFWQPVLQTDQQSFYHADNR
jgi:hypothetical protein